MVVRVRPNLLARALVNMERQGYECYAPRAVLRGPRGRPQVRPLFPGYVFARSSGAWASLNGTLGVLGLVMGAGEQPAALPAAEVDALRARESGDGLIHLEQLAPFKAGEPVRVARGAVSLDAVFDGMSGEDRVFVLLEFLGRQVRTEVGVEDVRPPG